MKITTVLILVGLNYLWSYFVAKRNMAATVQNSFSLHIGYGISYG